MEVLKTAYDLALQDHLRKIEEAKMSNDLFRWESVMYDYQKINQLADDINSCPACLTIVPRPSKYINELADSKYNAAGARYNSGSGHFAELYYDVNWWEIVLTTDKNGCTVKTVKI